MNPYLVGHRHLIRYGALDLVQGNAQEALNKVLHVLQQGSGPDLCDALMLRLFQSAATGQHGAAAALAGYMRLRWGDEQAARSLASLAPVLTQAPRDQGWTALAGLDWPGLAAAVQAKGEMPVSAPWPDISAGSRPLVVVGMSGGLGLGKMTGGPTRRVAILGSGLDENIKAQGRLKKLGKRLRNPRMYDPHLFPPFVVRR